MKRGSLVLSLVLVGVLIISSCTLCTKEGKVCEDGTVVGREGPDCEFPKCPEFDIVQEEIEEELISEPEPEQEFETEKVEQTVYELDLSINDLPEEYQELEPYLPKYGEIFGVHFFASNKVSDAKLLHAMNVMAEWLDNDKDRLPDNPLVVDKIVLRKGGMIMFEDEDEDEDSEVWDLSLEYMDWYNLVGLYEDETNPSYGFDASIEETLHLITMIGYADAYPEVFGEFSGSTVANLMDESRGGHFEEGTNWNEDSGQGDGAVPDSYSSSSWYHYDDETCSYACMITEYMYWSITSILGAQEDRCSEINDEWELCTKEKVQEKDQGIYSLLTDSQYNFPIILPTGNY